MTLNFLVVVSDTLRRDHLGCYGNPWIHTPHIDRFARDALIFDRAYLASFPTVPHRRDLFTGRFSGTYAQWEALPASETVLADVMTRAGYTTMMVNDCPHTLENGYHFDRGFLGFEWIRGQESDRWRTDPEAPTLTAEAWKLRDSESHDAAYLRHVRNRAEWQYEEDRYAPQTMTAAGRWLQRNYGATRPFFLYVDTFDPHEPWDAPPWYVDLYDPGYRGDAVDYPLYTKSDYLAPDELRHVRALYAAEVTMVDRWIGHLLDRLDDTGHRDDTVVILTTDHGFLHGEHGYVGKSVIDLEGRGGTPAIGHLPLWEEIARVPFMVRMPAGPVGRTDTFVQAPDVMPTLLDLAGVEVPPTVQGRSFAGSLRGDPGAAGATDVALSFPALTFGGIGGLHITATTERWSYICSPTSFDDRLLAGLMDYVTAYDEDNAFSTSAVDGMEKALQAKRTDHDELYDLDADPAQEHDVAADHEDVARALRGEIVERLRSLGTADPVVSCWDRPPG